MRHFILATGLHCCISRTVTLTIDITVTPVQTLLSDTPRILSSSALRLCPAAERPKKEISLCFSSLTLSLDLFRVISLRDCWKLWNENPSALINLSTCDSTPQHNTVMYSQSTTLVINGVSRRELDPSLCLYRPSSSSEDPNDLVDPLTFHELPPAY